MDKQQQVREELDEWLAEGKIDRATYDRLIAEQRGEPTDSLSTGLLAGAAGNTLGLGLCYLVLLEYPSDPIEAARVSLTLALVLGALGVMLARATDWSVLGRCVAIGASSLWTQSVLLWFASDFPPDALYLSTVFAGLALGHLALGYLASSAMVVFKGLTWLVPAVLFYLLEWDDGRYAFGHYACAVAALGGVFLVAAREHLVWRWPGQGLSRRFAMAYHVAGIGFINLSVYFLAWYGWDGDGYRNVLARLVCVTASVILYGLEVWAGQNRHMPWVSALGVIHFLLQVSAILSYPYVSLQQRALLVIGFALLLILVAQGDSSRRGGSERAP